jgi:anthranilate phosphoribosyltransferase
MERAFSRISWMEPNKMIRESIGNLVEGSHLSHEDAFAAMTEIISGSATDTQIGAFLTALSIKGETVEELQAMAEVMKSFSVQIHPRVKGRLVDTCGTGGDRLKTFNISTTSAFVVAGAGVPVAKHGNRSVTSKCGSADVLEALGLNLDMNHKQVEESIENVGIGFLFAPKFHPAMKHVAMPRKEIGIRTVFNILGPITNPANASAQLVGVYDERLVEKIAHTLKGLGCEAGAIVHGLDGMDEISTIGKTKIAWLKDETVKVATHTPSEFGVEVAKIEDLQVSTASENAKTTVRILLGTKGPKRDIVLVNAAVGILVGGLAGNLEDAMVLARRSIDDGAALQKLEGTIRSSGGSLSRLRELECDNE